MMRTGIELVVIGMGVVVSFLLLLVGCVHLLAAFFTRFAAWFPPEPSTPASRPPAPALDGAQTPLLAIALAAAHRARSGHPR